MVAVSLQCAPHCFAMVLRHIRSAGMRLVICSGKVHKRPCAQRDVDVLQETTISVLTITNITV